MAPIFLQDQCRNVHEMRRFHMANLTQLLGEPCNG
jgi:hypothetical protein